MALMRTIPEVTVIDLLWDGPLTLTEVEQHRHGANDYGVYQIYGTHNSGADQLLYIGRAKDNKFGERVPWIHEWADWEPKSVEIYLGRLGSVQPIPATLPAQGEWGEWICRVEAMLIYFTSPPLNSSGIRSLPELPDAPVIILNFARRHRLPAMVSNLYEKSPVGDSSQEWRAFVEPTEILDNPE
jgi:hypothetical protein